MMRVTMKTSRVENTFPGFDISKDSKFFKYPSEMDKYWYILSGSEQKVLDFILRQTIGFRQTSDTIAYSQIESGVKGFNNGTGLSRSQVTRAVNSLEDKGFITTVRRKRKPHIFNLVTYQNPSNESESYVINPEINRLIRLFEPIAGHLVEKFLTSNREQRAIEELVKNYGVEHIEQLINTLPLIQGLAYVPVVTSPTELEGKYPKVLVAIKRIRQEQNQNGCIL